MKRRLEKISSCLFESLDLDQSSPVGAGPSGGPTIKLTSTPTGHDFFHDFGPEGN
jgi:hypothetical protein